MSTTGIIFLVLSYLIGSIPTAVWISKFFYKIDIRDYGSGNPGATNTFRILGKRAGLTILLLDIFKGWIVVTLACYVSQAPPHTQDFVNLHISFGVASVLGHVFPIYIGFKGERHCNFIRSRFSYPSIRLFNAKWRFLNCFSTYTLCFFKFNLCWNFLPIYSYFHLR